MIRVTWTAAEEWFQSLMPKHLVSSKLFKPILDPRWKNKYRSNVNKIRGSVCWKKRCICICLQIHFFECRNCLRNWFMSASLMYTRSPFSLSLSLSLSLSHGYCSCLEKHKLWLQVNWIISRVPPNGIVHDLIVRAALHIICYWSS